MQPLTIKQWLDGHVKIKPSDLSALARKLEQYRLGYVGSNKETIAFYGSPYIGLYNIWFTTAYEHKLVNAILKLDKDKILHDLKAVDHEGRSKLVPAIYPERKVSGEWFNILLLYLAHLLVDVKHPTRAGMSAALIPLQLYAYRTLAAVHSNSFRYLGSEAVAKAVYNQLSNKFILKQLKSWDKYIEYRAVATLNLAHEKNALKLEDDEQALLLLIVTSNAIRSTFKIMYQLYLDIKESGEGELGDTFVKDGEDSTFIKEVINTESITQTLILRVADSSIIDVKTIRHVASVIPRVIYGDILQLLKEMSTGYIKNKKLSDLFVSSLVAFCADRMQSTSIKDYTSKVDLITKLYNSVSSSKIDLAVLDTVRTSANQLVSKYLPFKSEFYQTRLRIALVFYFIIMFVSLLN